MAYENNESDLDEDALSNDVINSIIDANKAFTCPSNLPVNRATASLVSRLDVQTNHGIIRDLEKELLGAAEEYLEFGVSHGQELSTANGAVVDSLKELADLGDSTDRLIKAISTSKRVVRQRLSDEAELSYKTLGHYRSLEDPPTRLAEMLDAEFQSIPSKGKSAGALDFQRRMFVVKNPLVPLPNELAEDSQETTDEVEVEGGTIELVCPLSRVEFVDPVKSSKCGHTFSRALITEYLEGQDRCPIAGCEAVLKRSTLKPDALMDLRVKSFGLLKTQADSNRRKNLEVVA